MTIAIALAYLVAAVLFILGLRQLSSPKGARNGNFTAAAGMIVASSRIAVPSSQSSPQSPSSARSAPGST